MKTYTQGEITAALNHAAVEDYLLAHGFVLTCRIRFSCGVWRCQKSQAEYLVPTDTTLADYGQLLFDAALKLGMIEKKYILRKNHEGS